MGFYRNGIIMDDSSGHPESYTQTFLAHHILLVFVCLTCEPSQLFYTTWSREAKMWDTHNLDNFSQVYHVFKTIFVYPVPPFNHLSFFPFLVISSHPLVSFCFHVIYTYVHTHTHTHSMNDIHVLFIFNFQQNNSYKYFN